MDENTGDGENTQTSTGTQRDGQMLPNDTMNRTADRTCTQKLTIPTLEKQDQANASMWWRKFVQYYKNDERHRLVNHDEQQRNPTTIP